MKKISIILKALFIASCFFGLALTIQDSPSFVIYISYYTTQSNILCLIVMIIYLLWMLFGKGKNRTAFMALKSVATVSILVTFLIYHFLLRPNMEPDMDNVAKGLGNIIVHYITPLYFFADYLLFDEKGHTRLFDLLFYVIFPIYYLIFANFRAVYGVPFQYGETISQFPYPFLDYEVFGIYGVSIAVLVITLAVAIIGFLYINLDHVLKKPKELYPTHTYGAISLKPKEPEQNTKTPVLEETSDAPLEQTKILP